MNRHPVTFLPSGQTIEVPDGTTLLQAEILAGLKPDAPCGGRGTCKKCLVTLVGADGTQTVLACQTPVHTDLCVWLAEQGVNQILIQGSGKPLSVDAPVKSVACTVPRCQAGENRADFDLLRRALTTACGESTEFLPSLSVAADLHEQLEASNYQPYAVCFQDAILALRPTDGSLYGMAFDIGTTSVVGYLMDLKSGAALAAVSAMNPQAQFGADVIMRANYALEHGGKALSDAIRTTLRDLMLQAISLSGVRESDIFLVTAVGNTCMHHLLLDISPASLVHAPYNPALSDALTLSAFAFGLPVHPQAKLLVLPNIAGFVGADTVGVLLSTEFDRLEPMTLAIDIGTNGEMVLGNRHRRIACSTAAGPAFEGAKIDCGMRGAVGAIDHVRLENEDLRFTVIGDGKPSGICGSGLMDLVAVLLDAGMLDESGRLLSYDAVETPAALANRHRLTQIDGQPAFLLANAEESASGKPVYLSQKDIREVQLAKGAMAAGILLLAKAHGVSIAGIDQVLIAGAFGNYMSPHSACRIGLIPPELEAKIRPIGNAAGEGAKMALLSGDAFSRATDLARETEFLELASDPDFQDTFVEELAFPELE